MSVRFADSTDPRIAQFYAESGYTGGLAASDRLVVAERGDALLGLYRLAREHGVIVLRGMQVHASAQRQGIGRMLLAQLRELDETCYCIPHGHLSSFYASAGFVPLSEEQSPAFLRERLARYRSQGLDVLLMKREAP